MVLESYPTSALILKEVLELGFLRIEDLRIGWNKGDFGNSETCCDEKGEIPLVRNEAM